MKKRIILFLVMVSALCAHSFAQRNLLAKEDDAIPPGFGKVKTTLLVINNGNFQVDKCLEKTFEKYYTGNYLIIDEMEQYNKRYNDTVKYKYTFIVYTDNQKGKWVRGGGGSSGYERQGPTTNYSYGVMDRTDSKEYHISFFGGGYKGLMEAYVKKLEEERKKNGQ